MRILQHKNFASLEKLGLTFPPAFQAYSQTRSCSDADYNEDSFEDKILNSGLKQDCNRVPKKDGRATNLPPELGKTLLSMAYLFVVTWITAFVMVIVHDRVPDMKKYPPLPDIFLDNVPTISWAFHMCEVTGSLLLLIWVAVLLTHKHRYHFYFFNSCFIWCLMELWLYNFLDVCLYHEKHTKTWLSTLISFIIFFLLEH